MERLDLVYATHLAFYREDSRRQEGAEVSFGEVATTGGPWHLSYIPASGDLYLGAPGSGEVELLARLTDQEAKCLLTDWQAEGDLSWLRARLRAPQPGPRRRLSALGAA